jgi:hypothetical protein
VADPAMSRINRSKTALVTRSEPSLSRELFDRIFMPIVVHAELTRPKTPAPVRSWADGPPGWLTVLPEPLDADAAPEGLHAGERAAWRCIVFSNYHEKGIPL